MVEDADALRGRRRGWFVGGLKCRHGRKQSLAILHHSSSSDAPRRLPPPLSPDLIAHMTLEANVIGLLPFFLCGSHVMLIPIFADISITTILMPTITRAGAGRRGWRWTRRPISADIRSRSGARAPSSQHPGSFCRGGGRLATGHQRPSPTAAAGPAGGIFGTHL
ncbi:hypothetical protein CONLIGDRAFT_278577 [Coniochaeta ligniaria NRRL 30616]|uniref:Uncharacterized protein n=1 Tax=Coniochaeta ligniaria NRRL 30616 TaxID=1408157 RepID=A0A1J7J449_9PEZI|nr:hypothetical protein CONLIGDRAFT_278577 [Coniochaeta ligniaria NRRL 30616]